MTEFITYFLMGYYDYLISGMCISAMLLAFARFIFKDRLEIAAAVQILRWIIIIYGMLTILRFLIGPGHTEFFSSSRMTGEYWWAYWSMIISATIVPLLFLFRKIGKSILAIFLAGFLMSLGRIWESIIIHMVNMQRDYLRIDNPYLLYAREWESIFYGFILGLMAILTVNIGRKRKGLEAGNV